MRRSFQGEMSIDEATCYDLTIVADSGISTPGDSECNGAMPHCCKAMRI
ncbi:MAG: hypothetical protein ABGX22_10875 [Pirellulaceae bacterium]